VAVGIRNKNAAPRGIAFLPLPLPPHPWARCPFFFRFYSPAFRRGREPYTLKYAERRAGIFRALLETFCSSHGVQEINFFLLSFSTKSNYPFRIPFDIISLYSTAAISRKPLLFVKLSKIPGKANYVGVTNN
jgi:hypothetical protein